MERLQNYWFVFITLLLLTPFFLLLWPPLVALPLWPLILLSNNDARTAFANNAPPLR